MPDGVIRALGEYVVGLQFHPEVIVDLPVEVVAE
jgi:ribosomal protein L9